jgi:uncharacterized protein (TIGR03435 family)
MNLFKVDGFELYAGRFRGSGFMLGKILAAGLFCAGTAVGQTATVPAAANVAGVASSVADDALPEFEVATIKPRDPNGHRMITPPGAQNPFYTETTCQTLIAMAYDIPASSSERIIGLPDWARNYSKTFAVEGKIPDSTFLTMQTMTASDRRKKVTLMIRSLLADRFHLRVHLESRTLPIYEITIAKSGPRLPPPQDSEGPPSTPEAAQRVSRSMQGMEVVTKQGISVRNLALDDMLRAHFFGLSDRIIVNNTGLTGKYSLTLHWQPDLPATPGSDSSANAGRDQPSIFTVLEEQLGLKLVPTKGPLEVVVVDGIDQPSDN